MKKESNDFGDKVFQILAKNPEFLSTEGDILKDRLIDNAYKVDRKLIEILK